MIFLLSLVLSFQNPEYAGFKMRKLHLVRPDLIPYPIPTEIYC